MCICREREHESDHGCREPLYFHLNLCDEEKVRELYRAEKSLSLVAGLVDEGDLDALCCAWIPRATVNLFCGRCCDGDSRSEI